MNNFKKMTRNIFNLKELNINLEKIIENKKLNDYPHIKSWVLNNVKNYFLHKVNLTPIEFTDLDEESKKIIILKKIQPKYHKIEIKNELIDEINHNIDYLKSEFKKPRDLSRLNIEQARINADKWLKNKIKNLSTEEDYENIKLVLDITDKEKKYTWVSIHSHKALKRESKLMNHCIEDYWDDISKGKDKILESPFYSLRDDKNKPIITAYIVEQQLNNYKYTHALTLIEVKEKNNEFLSHEKRHFLKELLIDFYKNNNKTRIIMVEDKSCLIDRYYQLMNRKSEDFDIISSVDDFIKDKQKYREKIFTTNDLEEFKEIYPIENILKSLKFEELNIENYLNQENYFNANKLNINNINNKNIKLDSPLIIIKNAINCSINIETFNNENSEIKQVLIYAENIKNCFINVKSNVENISYILKNSIYRITNTNEKNNNFIINIDSKYEELNLIKTINNKNIIFNIDKNNHVMSNYSYSKKQQSFFLSDSYDKLNLLKEALRLYKYYLKKDDKLSLVEKNIIDQLDIKIDEKKSQLTYNFNYEITLYKYKLQNGHDFIGSFFKNAKEEINTIINSVEPDLLIKDEELFLENNLLSLVKKENLILSNKYENKTDEYYNKYKKMLEPIKNQFYLEIEKNNDLALTNLFRSLLKDCEEKKLAINSLILNVVKNEIIENCSLIKNEASDGIITNNRIRTGRAHRISNYILDNSKSNLSKNEVNDILSSDYNLIKQETNNINAKKYIISKY